MAKGVARSGKSGSATKRPSSPDKKQVRSYATLFAAQLPSRSPRQEKHRVKVAFTDCNAHIQRRPS